jgi:pyruvate formate lyase activating enzyme
MHEQRQSLNEHLLSLSIDGELYSHLKNNSVECHACGHRCLIRDNRDGICKVRFNRGGKLLVPANYVAALQVDPTEKKPFFHVVPGSLALTFGMLGCDYHCGYCQNWITSQTLRDPAATGTAKRITAEDLSNLATIKRARLVVSSYNEPLITSEWAVQVFRKAKTQGFLTGYVSNGNGTDEVLDFIRPHTDLYKIDLKSFSDKQYRKLGGVLKNVLDTVIGVHQRGFWLEIVTLIVPGFNDTETEIRDIAEFIAQVSIDIPWHVTGFHQDYKMKASPNTTVNALTRAAEIGYESGLNFVYAGNLHAHESEYENTFCPDCKNVLIRRFGFRILDNQLVNGACSACGKIIPGIWS